MKQPSKRTPRRIGLGLIVAGVLVAAVALLADVLGLGGTPEYYGHYQFITTVIGLSLLVLGTTVILSTVNDEDGED